MYGKFDNIAIQGICSTVPSTVEDNEIYASVLGERRVKKQIKLTGVKQRHISSQAQRASDLCFAATLRMLDHLKWNRDEIKIMVFITQGPDFALPSTAFFLHKRLGLAKDCVVFDLNLGCSSFDVGIQTVASMLQPCNEGDKALLLLGDTASNVKYSEKYYRDSEITHDMLFGSEGTCIAMEKKSGSNLFFANMSDGNGYQAILKKFSDSSYPTQMDGSAVFEFAINDVTKTVNEFRKEFAITDDMVDYYVFHQAQQLILDNILDACNISPDKELRSLYEYGNTSGGSVALTINANCDTLKEIENPRLLCCGFGVGLSWGCIYTSIPSENILPVFECDDHYWDEWHSVTTYLRGCSVAIFGADKPLGEWIAKNNKKVGASTILIGNDTGYIDAYINDMSFKPVVIKEDSYENALSSIDSEIDGIVITEHISEQDFDTLCKSLPAKDSAINIVLIDGVSKDGPDRITEEHLRKLFEIAANEDRDIRVNAILYNQDTIDVVPNRGFGQEWAETFIKEGCPETMAKAAYISHAEVFLLSDQGRYVRNSIIVQD